MMIDDDEADEQLQHWNGETYWYISRIEFLKNLTGRQTLWFNICIWIKSSYRALLLLNKKEIHTFAFIPAAQRFHSWNPNKTASMNIVMICFVCSEAWAGPEIIYFILQCVYCLH